MIPPAAEELTVLGLRLLMAAALLGFVAAVAVVAMRELAALGAAATPGAAGRRSETGPRTLALMVLEGGRSSLAPGTRWAFETGGTIGRRPGNAVVIDDPFLSGEHAEVVREAGGWWLRDKGSTNGTLLNGTPVAALTAIRPGDVLQFGRIRLQVLVGDPPPPSAR